jgi:hypothetical protein
MPRREISNDQPYYEAAQICLNGHVITDRYNSSPQRRKNFCPHCGAQTMHQCSKCNEPLQGAYIIPGVVVGGGRPLAPAFCHNCGQPFPWTEMRLEAARELTLQAEELESDAEKQDLVNSLPDLVTDTPRTTVAANKWKKALEKLGEYTAGPLKEIFVQVATETAKRLLFPN